MKSMCPSCDAMVEVPMPANKNTKFECENCGEPLKVFKLNPVELDYDFDDDDYDYEDSDDDIEDY